MHPLSWLPKIISVNKIFVLSALKKLPLQRNTYYGIFFQDTFIILIFIFIKSYILYIIKPTKTLITNYDMRLSHDLHCHVLVTREKSFQIFFLKNKRKRTPQISHKEFIVRPASRINSYLQTHREWSYRIRLAHLSSIWFIPTKDESEIVTRLYLSSNCSVGILPSSQCNSGRWIWLRFHPPLCNYSCCPLVDEKQSI